MDNNKKRKYKKRKPEQESVFSLDALDEEGRRLYYEIFAEYNKNNIIKLREQARNMGIKSSTTLPKAKLVEKMTQARLSRTTYLGGGGGGGTGGIITYGEIQSLTDDFWQRTLVLNPVEIKGILKIESEGGFIRAGFAPDPRSDTFLPLIIIDKYKLQSGDELTVQARMLKKAGRLGAYRVLQINGKPSESYNRHALTQLACCNKMLQVNSTNRFLTAINKITPFFMGERKLIIGLNSLRIDTLAFKISQKLCEAGLETINLFLDQRPEVFSLASGLGGKMLFTECSDPLDYNESVALAVQYTLTAAAAGRNMAIILSNADVLTESTLRAVFGAGRFTQNGSVTCVILSSSLELEPVINKLSRSANSITYFKREAVPVIDVVKSFTEFEDLLPESDKKRLFDLRSKSREINVDQFNLL